MIEFVAWIVMLAIVVCTTVVCWKPRVDLKTVRIAAPLLAVAFLGTCSLIVHILVCGCNCFGTIVSKMGRIRVVFGIITCVASIVLVRTVASSYNTPFTVVGIGNIALFLIVGFGCFDSTEDDPEPLLP